MKYTTIRSFVPWPDRPHLAHLSIWLLLIPSIPAQCSVFNQPASQPDCLINWQRNWPPLSHLISYHSMSCNVKIDRHPSYSFSEWAMCVWARMECMYVKRRVFKHAGEMRWFLLRGNGKGNGEGKGKGEGKGERKVLIYWLIAADDVRMHAWSYLLSIKLKWSELLQTVLSVLYCTVLYI